jgi:hypothetical protein
MITAAEVARAVQGCWRLARLDPSGMDFFDKTIDGFWRSFWVAVLVAPAYLLLGWFDGGGAAIEAGPARHYTVEVIAYVISWVAYPFAMFYLTRLMDRGEDYVGYIVAYNWSHIFQVAVFLPVWATAPVDPTAPSGWSLIMTVATIIVLIYVGYIAKTALRITAMMASGVVALDVALSLFIGGIRDALLLSG